MKTLFSFPSIDGNVIHYVDHVVTCAKDAADAEYMKEMAASLSTSGSAKDHREELVTMNNDGSWTVRRINRLAQAVRQVVPKHDYSSLFTSTYQDGRRCVKLWVYRGGRDLEVDALKAHLLASGFTEVTVAIKRMHKNSRDIVSLYVWARLVGASQPASKKEKNAGMTKAQISKQKRLTKALALLKDLKVTPIEVMAAHLWNDFESTAAAMNKERGLEELSAESLLEAAHDCGGFEIEDQVLGAIDQIFKVKR